MNVVKIIAVFMGSLKRDFYHQTGSCKATMVSRLEVRYKNLGFSGLTGDLLLPFLFL